MNKFSTSHYLNRHNSLRKLKENAHWDIIIIGGGATGLGVALDASSRGFKTLLLERDDFASGTSSRSTKLAHGGVRYLAQGNLGLVKEALKERGLLLQNAPHLVKMLPFVIPSYKWWEKFYYGIGLKVYDWMAKGLRIGKTEIINTKKVKSLFHNLNLIGLSGGVIYYDGQFDDARLALNIAQTAAENDATLLNYFEVNNLLKKEGKVSGVFAKDLETGESFEVNSKIVINATGVFADSILSLNRKNATPIIKVSQGIHLVLKREFLQSEEALMIPKTSDGRVLFAVPWKDHLLVGTTDTPMKAPSKEPKPLEEEINFILKTLQNYLVKKPTINDVLSVYAGLRPLVVPQDEEKGTKEISRDHKLITDKSKLITITGGKWTTYRKMAEDTVDEAIKVGGLKDISCITENLKIHGFSEKMVPQSDPFYIYGSDAKKIKKLSNEKPGYKEQLHPSFPHIVAEVIWFIRFEMGRTVEDVLARRFRILFLDAQAAVDMAPKIASLLKNELNKDDNWEKEQIAHFKKIAGNYFPKPFKKVKSNKKKEINI
ncbi:glycerol-3-phosphate dehydrogenase/oxidase [Gramella sp. AN32]|uniref:Glycerol-3-phosphate dehydrogenase/oxidase n=1 Tax=Christiangramia antarctica TaxID=2058158 RepID=A0ABW5X275_9FLAO|nr:glycerol-3-phosphate dehydrogenase/oxidase [Gramella sp. AN32]MCM4155711.1 FAD-dependent oxidoreductase [Gramella sp. AN32]